MAKTFSIISTGWGFLRAVWSEQGLWDLSFPGPDLDVLKAGISPSCSQEKSERTALLARELTAYFEGVKLSFATPVDWDGYTPFQQAVLRRTADIPYGSVLTYAQVAQLAGSPRGARAAGGALHINRTPIVVPCHRVIGASGSLVGFGGGLAMKQALLRLENYLS